MNFLVNSETAEALKTALESKNKEAVRVNIRGFGWGGPEFGIVLDEQKDEDEAVTVDGVKIVAERDIAYLFDNAKILYTKGLFGSRFQVVASNGRGSCR